MKSNWNNCISLLLVSEGPELNVAASEPGGASKYGVSVSALSDLRRSQGLKPATVDDVATLTEQTASDFYAAVTGKACRFDDMPVGVDYLMLDVTTNLGPAGGAWLLQNVLGAWPLANAVTPDTLSTALRVPPSALVYALGAAWLAKKKESAGWPKSGHGWTNRMVRVRADALKMTEET